jgi:hypothetical protein
MPSVGPTFQWEREKIPFFLGSSAAPLPPTPHARRLPWPPQGRRRASSASAGAGMVVAVFWYLLFLFALAAFSCFLLPAGAGVPLVAC